MELALIIHGGFSMVNGIDRSQLARLHSYELRLDPPTRLSNGQVIIHVRGQPAARFITQISTNLITWSPLATNTFVTSSFGFAVSVAPASFARFYRAVLDGQ